MKTLIIFLVFVCAATGLMAQSSTSNRPTQPLLFTEAEFANLTFATIPGIKVDTINNDTLENRLRRKVAAKLKRWNEKGVVPVQPFDSVTQVFLPEQTFYRDANNRERIKYGNMGQLAKITVTATKLVYHIALGSENSHGIDITLKKFYFPPSGQLFIISKNKGEVYYSLNKDNQVEPYCRESSIQNKKTFLMSFCNAEGEEEIDGLIIEYSQDINETDATDLGEFFFTHNTGLGRMKYPDRPLDYPKKKVRTKR